VLGKDGSEAMCLLDSTQGIVGPRGIAVDDDGQLWVGCIGGNIHIIEFWLQHSDIIYKCVMNTLDWYIIVKTTKI